ncbi:class I SAM-dependent methyltransferase [Streptomyces sp. CB01881]|uniref:class I SAM-dependent methyltransferase n=1 Tax=Streptomyces sp. CB01881 TaxID=2078691 RepID=UPI000CDCA4D5|nr:class I SAM-dependent methyltransferase [Streptomyces sp. CB01881]AUY49742.1 SAM-dependent methyltransferase [Streptomyces sp. CB01881]TYC73132.1 class I SAM-dependent methyltransferase [Streptomyces sp. CB01881]
MTSNAAQQDAAIADKAVLTHSAYADGRHLAARQSIYRWQQPQYDLPGIVVEELADASGTVLDVGCGNGKFVSRLHRDRPDLRVVGVDISAGILAEVEKPALVADAQALPFADGSADAVLALHMLYHVGDIEATINDLARVLNPEGTLLVSTNSDTDKRELDQLWKRAAGDVLGIPVGPERVSLSSRFSLEKAPDYLGAVFGEVRVRELPGIIEVTDPAPLVAHLASYEAWAEQCGVPFRETVGRAHDIAADTIAEKGSFKIACLGGLLVCRR